MEYGAIVMDPYMVTNINKLEKIQRQAARLITMDYKSRKDGCVSNMLEVDIYVQSGLGADSRYWTRRNSKKRTS